MLSKLIFQDDKHYVSEEFLYTLTYYCVKILSMLKKAFQDNIFKMCKLNGIHSLW